MFLAPEGEELEIANAAAEFLAGVIPIERAHTLDGGTLDAALRQTIAEMGWFGLAVSEAGGGSGLSAVEHALFFREVGRHCGPIDILSQTLAAMTAVDAPELRAALLAGERGVALASKDGEGLRIFGAPDSTLALYVDDDGARVLDISGEALEARPALDPSTFIRIGASAGAPVVASRRDDHVARMGRLGVAAMLVGLAETALELIVEYAKVRETFGRKIGSYQAVRHPCADMALRAEAARCQLWFAAAAIKEGRADADTHLDAAKHLANQGAVTNADVNIQLHGGIGVTDEHAAHLLLKRALLLSRLFGTKRTLMGRLLHAQVEQ